MYCVCVCNMEGNNYLTITISKLGPCVYTHVSNQQFWEGLKLKHFLYTLKLCAYKLFSREGKSQDQKQRTICIVCVQWKQTTFFGRPNIEAFLMHTQAVCT